MKEETKDATYRAESEGLRLLVFTEELSFPLL